MLDALVPVIIFFIVVSGVIKSIREAAAKHQAARPVIGGKAQSELEAFLSDVRSQKGVAGDDRPRPEPDAAAAQRESADRRGSQQRQKQSRSQTQKSRRGQGRNQTDTNQRSGSRPAGNTRPAHHAVGSGVVSHLDSSIDEHVRQHLGEDPSGQNRQLPGRSVQLTGTPQASAAEESVAGDILKALKSPAGVRHAIMVNEILTRPRSLRRR